MEIYWAARNIPRLDKEKDGGDDGWFISNESQSAGVADGVGSWRKKGINSGRFSRSLMYATKRRIEQGMNPYDALQSAFADWENKTGYGSTTFCVAQLIEDILHS